jgi:hypothetical protein
MLGRVGMRSSRWILYEEGREGSYRKIGLSLSLSVCLSVCLSVWFSAMSFSWVGLGRSSLYGMSV